MTYKQLAPACIKLLGELQQLPPFALLYLDDKDWFEIIPFNSQEAMEQFVAEHSKPEITQK